MLIPRIVRGGPDKIFTTVRNLHSTTLGDGDCVQWLTFADTPPTGYTTNLGNDVKQSVGAAASGTIVAGIMSIGGVATTINQGDFGLCQVWGIHNNVKCTLTAPTVNSVMTSDAAGAVVLAVVAAAANITDQRVVTLLKTGLGGRAIGMVKAMGTP